MQTDPLASSDPPRPAPRAWVAATLLRRPALLTRFHSAYERLRALPRGARRRIQRRAAVSLAGAALLLAMSGSPLLVPRAHAASITVGGTCSLADAIRSANNDISVGTCTAGSGPADTITLTGDVTLTASSGNYYLSDTGLPLIDSTITLDGAGFTIERDGAAPEFRLLAITSDGDLTLRDVTLSGGHSEGRGGAVYNDVGVLNVLDSTITHNYANSEGGGIFNDQGTLTITDSTISFNEAEHGGGVYSDDGGATATITGSTITSNEAGGWGGGLYNDYGSMTVIDSLIAGNSASSGSGGGLQNYDGTLTITGSSITGNSADDGGGIWAYSGLTTVTNSTISGNSANDGGGIYNYLGSTTVTNSTITGNSAGNEGGGIYGTYDSTTNLVRSIVSGNSATVGNEVYVYSGMYYYGTVNADAHNVLGHSGLANATAFTNFTPGASDITATSDGNTPTALAAILDTTLADNGGPTETHNLVAGSPAIDLAPDAGCAAAPTSAVDQRGAPRPLDGDSSPSANECDAGAVEYLSPVPGDVIYVSAATAGTTDDNLAFGPHDILEWDGSAWSKGFDGTAAGLTPNGKNKHNLAGFWIPDPAEDDVVLAFVQNSRKVPGISGKVDGMDLVWWDGSAFSLWFDGQDVGLTNLTNEKIDALHVLDGALSPIGSGCLNYLLISTQGPGNVPGVGKFGGEDVLGFCQTNVGPATAGFWHKLIDGSDEGVPRNAINGLSFSDDGQTMYLTTHGNFVVDAATGGHSMVYRYDFGSGEFSGPEFIAADAGLHQKVNGLDIDLPAIIP